MGNASTYVSNTRAKEQSNQYSQLICMGFDESISLKAATIHPTNINAAITYIASQSSSQTSSANDNNGSKSIDWPLNFPVYITIGHEAHQTGFTLTKEMYLKWKVVDVLRLLIEKMTEMQYRLMTPDHDQTISSAKDYTCIYCEKINPQRLDVSMACKSDSITNCKSMQSFTKRLKEYTHSDTNHNIQKVDCTEILNEFHHILMYHAHNDEDFDYIVNQCGGPCALEQCNTIRRCHGDRSKYQTMTFIEEVLDRMHCHILHGYDMFRFTQEERKEINDSIHGAEDEEESVRLKLLCIISQRKRSRFNALIPQNRFMRDTNKFSSNLGQTAIVKDGDAKVDNGDDCKHNPTSYSFGYNFNYWPRCKHSEHGGKGGWLKDLYVAPKHSSLKEELLNNRISSIDLKTWTDACNEAEAQTKSHQYKQTNAQLSLNSGTNDDDPIYYGYREGDPMEKKHLMAVIVYCGEDEFQMKYSETYRTYTIEK
eukprot:517895_1